jgi:hypothetical protein
MSFRFSKSPPEQHHEDRAPRRGRIGGEGSGKIIYSHTAITRRSARAIDDFDFCAGKIRGDRDQDAKFCAKIGSRDGSFSADAQDFFQNLSAQICARRVGGNRAETLYPSRFAAHVNFQDARNFLPQSQNVVPHLERKLLTLQPVVATPIGSRVMSNAPIKMSHRFFRSASADRKGVSL